MQEFEREEVEAETPSEDRALLGIDVLSERIWHTPGFRTNLPDLLLRSFGFLFS